MVPIKRIFLFAFVLLTSAVNAITINVVTEDEFPIQFVEDGRLKGPAFEVVSELLATADFAYETRVLPWSRAYLEAQTKPNTLIFSIVRTEHREDNFHWIGEIQDIAYALIKLKRRADLQVPDLNSLGTKRIGVIRDSALHIYFENLGLAANLIVFESEQVSYNVLLKERVDFIPRNVPIMELDCLNLSLDCSQFEVVYELSDFNNGVYIAMSKNSDDEVVSKISDAFTKLKDSGVVHALMKDTYTLKK